MAPQVTNSVVFHFIGGGALFSGVGLVAAAAVAALSQTDLHSNPGSQHPAGRRFLLVFLKPFFFKRQYASQFVAAFP